MSSTRLHCHPASVVELFSTEYGPGGRYAGCPAGWTATPHHYGFFLPYDRDRGGVQPEPWHLSLAAVAGPALGAMQRGDAAPGAG